MLVRIRLQPGRQVARKQRKNRRLALAFGALLIPASLMAYVLGFWRLASDMGLTGEFTINGFFSHWQIWIAMAAVLHLGATVLSRYGRGAEALLPRFLTFRLGTLPVALETPPSNASRTETRAS